MKVFETNLHGFVTRDTAAEKTLMKYGHSIVIATIYPV